MVPLKRSRCCHVSQVRFDQGGKSSARRGELDQGGWSGEILGVMGVCGGASEQTVSSASRRRREVDIDISTHLGQLVAPTVVILVAQR